MMLIRDRIKPRRAQKPKDRGVLFAIIAGSLCVGVAFLAATVLLASCSASIASTIRSDGGATISVRAQIPPALAAKVRKLSSAGSAAKAPSNFFDAQAIRASLAARKGLELVELKRPSPESVEAVVAARSLQELAAAPDIKSAGLLTLTHGPGWIECRIRMDRKGAPTLLALFPGIDRGIAEALSPPALEEDPLTELEYETMLKSVLGEKALAALRDAAIDVSISAPGEVLESGGGTLTASGLTCKLPVIRILTLEKPIELWLRWKQRE